MGKKRILLKLTGEIFVDPKSRKITPIAIKSIVAQIKQLLATHQFGIVIGGGNFFRGNDQGTIMELSAGIGHQIGMLATMMNGLMLKNLCEQQNISAELLCAIDCTAIGQSITPATINRALKNEDILIFTGGTGNPFFTTDTAAILRALQIGTHEVWKGTTVDGIYTADPAKDTNAKKIDSLTYAAALQKQLGIMDLTAYAMAERYQVTVRVFDIFAPNALLNVVHNPQFGSTLS
jgi:uridylate kinase